jgi:dienelactone hydrolase
MTIGGVSYDSSASLAAKVTPLFNPTSPPKGPQAVLSYRIVFNGANGSPVPGIFMAPVTASAHPASPCVLLLHGLGGSKTDVLVLGIALARRGFASFAIDVAGHGERPKIQGKPVNKLTTTEMHDLVATTAVDLRRAVDFVQTRPEVDGDRIGFLGISLGGIIGGLFAGNEPRLQAVSLWAAGGNWGKLFATSQHPFAIEFRKTNAVTSAEALEKIFADVDPLSVVTRIAPRPLLLINGTRDNIVPRACADLLFNAAQQPKQRVLLPGGHIPDVSLMGSESLAFFDKHLKKPSR